MAASVAPAAGGGSIETLVQHGLSEPASAALYRLGLTLRRRMIRTPSQALWVEHAGMIDAQTGRQLSAVAVGTLDGVDVDAQLKAAQGHRAASVHTHPGSSAFSPNDAILLVEEPVLSLIVVVGADMTWYVLSVQPDALPTTSAVIEQRYEQTAHALAPRYDGLYALGLSDAEVWQEHSHGIWQDISASLGLRYDRIG